MVNCTLLLFVLVAPTQQATDFTDAVEKRVESLRGSCERAKSVAGKPIIGIDLRATKVTDADMRWMGQLDSLMLLDLGDTDISDAGLAHLEKLTDTSRVILLTKTKVTKAGVAKLQRALPRAQIVQ